MYIAYGSFFNDLGVRYSVRILLHLLLLSLSKPGPLFTKADIASSVLFTSAPCTLYKWGV